MYSKKQLQFGADKYNKLPNQCRKCQYLFACNGECPKNRTESGLNYLCKGYYRFFDYVAPAMDFMKNELMNQRRPANIMHVNWKNKL